MKLMWTVALAVGLTAMAFRPAKAQIMTMPLVRVAPNIYQAAPAGAPPAFYPPAPSPLPEAAWRTTPGQLASAFAMEQTDDETAGDTTRARYVASGVTVTLTPMGRPGAGRRFVGDMEIVTETTLDAAGGGTIRGTLTFTARNGNGMVARLVTGGIEGVYGEQAGDITVRGTLNVPSTNPYERTLTGAISATLASDANLNVRLAGMAAVQTL